MPSVVVPEQLEARVVRTDWNNRETPRSVVVGDDSRLFNGVSQWPRIDDLFAAQSLSILAAGGIPAWLGMGGRRGHDGRLSFGPVSSPALEILKGLTAAHDGFLWTDDAGMTWAMRLGDVVRGREALAYAVTYRGTAWVLDPDARRAAMAELEAQLAACNRPARRWDEADRARFARLARALHRLRLAEVAVRLVAHLQTRVGDGQAGSLLLEDAEIKAVVHDQDRSTSLGQIADDPVAVLHGVMGVEVAQIRFGHLGWDPRTESRSMAVTSVAQCGASTYRLQISPLLGDVIAKFSQRSTSRRHRHTRGRLAVVETAALALAAQ